MASRVLIIESSMGSAVPPEFELLVPSRRMNWSDFAAHSVDEKTTQLILAGSSRDATPAVSFLTGLRSTRLAVPVLALLPADTDDDLLKAAMEAADDFMFCPVRGDELNLRIAKFVGAGSGTVHKTGQRLNDGRVLAKLVGEHPVFVDAIHQVERIGRTDAPVLITGETGTGKELFAHAIHSLSGRRDGPFIPVDCATLPEQIAENELFGHRRGAFTDAYTDQKGMAGMAEGGTLFLDEIDALSLANQAKLLRFLQEGSYRSLGADRFTRANVRVIAATNQRMEDRVRMGLFRADLYFRINVLRLQLTPLRERCSDISLLARHFLETDCNCMAGSRKAFSLAALRKLESHHWPGNIRELLNTVQRAQLRASGKQILPGDIEIDCYAAGPALEKQAGTLQSAKRKVIESFERSYIEELLNRHQGNITRAAEDAGKDRRAFGRLAKKYGLSAGPGDACA